MGGIRGLPVGVGNPAVVGSLALFFVPKKRQLSVGKKVDGNQSMKQSRRGAFSTYVVPQIPVEARSRLSG